MLEQLMGVLRMSGTINVQAVATQLNTSPEMVMVMLEHLERSGLVSGSNECDLSACDSCPMGSNACNHTLERKVRFWKIKGQ